MENSALIQKADLTLADLSAGGYLNEEQTDKFIRKMMDTPTVLNAARVVTMESHTKQVNKLGFGTRMLRKAVSGQPLAQADRYKPQFGQIKLDTDEVIAVIYLPYDMLEDNIERSGNTAGALQAGPGGLHQTIVDMMAERAAIDLEELGFLGDTAAVGDDYLAMTDGWLKRANVNIVNAAGATISKTVLKAGVKAMPDKYLRDRANMLHIVSVDNETELRDTYASRNTALGDASLQGVAPLYMHGSRVVGASVVPAAKGLYVNPQNLLFGIWRKIQIEYTKDIEARCFKIVLTARVGFQIEEPEATVQYTAIG